MKAILLFLLLVSGYCFAQLPAGIATIPSKVPAKPLHNPPDIVNSYTEVISYDTCKNAVTVTNSTKYKVGDTVLLIQMKGALIDTSNTASFGTILDYKNAGNYEFNFISRKNGNQLAFKNRLTRSYDIPTGVVQLVRIPYYTDTLLPSGLTCMAWDGSKGGVLAVIVSKTLSSIGPMDVEGLGFKGGEGYNTLLPPSNCFQNNYNYGSASQVSSYKGESITTISNNIKKGKGSPAGGGGGGLSFSSGGGGGANFGIGGFGGYQSDRCGAVPFDNRGIGGKNLTYTQAANKIFMGSGGGAGHADNTDSYSTSPKGGAGGGIAIIIADTIDLLGDEILAGGGLGQYCNAADCRDGRGGGGAGGTVLLSTLKIVDTLTIKTNGGDGGFVNAPILPGENVGPGGGGGGGVLYFTGSMLPTNVGVVNSGGEAGYLNTPGNTWGATNGTAGSNFSDLVLPVDNILFKPNIDSVRFTDSAFTCNSFRFLGSAYTNTYPINSYSWSFGDGNNATGQNAFHLYNMQNVFPVTLYATDINGCKDSITKIINSRLTPVLKISKANDINCTLPYTKLHVTGADTYSWMPKETISNTNTDSPTAAPGQSTTYFVTGSYNNGCSTTDSIKIAVDFSAGVLLLPNSFTPNGDGLNDCFGLKYHGNIQSFTLTIFDRYGEKVFRTNNISQCWDGTFNGKNAIPGNYVYSLTAKTSCGNVNKKGSVLLIR